MAINAGDLEPSSNCRKRTEVDQRMDFGVKGYLKGPGNG